ncbi:MAG TPA: SDR family oxidoreductase [Candidatus Eisenbacteria bacterium]|nr:SDR family oxidoreductase [Candidatus Eisenbacteria bacterium]
MIPLDLDGRRALVTGAGAGIGRAIAIWLARAGCDVAVNDLDRGRAAETVELVLRAGRSSTVAVADVRRESDVAAMVEETLRALGGLDVAVNNVGMLGGHHARPFLETDVAAIRGVVDQNLVATALSCHAEATAMVRQGSGGVIINVSSGESGRPSPGLAVYGAAKAAINHLTRTLALELGPHGIRVNAMAPGTTLTEQVRVGLGAEYLEALRASIPLGRMTEPDDMGRTAVYLASDLARDVTGQLILVDGGADLSRNRPRLDR